MYFSMVTASLRRPATVRMLEMDSMASLADCSKAFFSTLSTPMMIRCSSTTARMVSGKNREHTRPSFQLQGRKNVKVVRMTMSLKVPVDKTQQDSNDDTGDALYSKMFSFDFRLSVFCPDLSDTAHPGPGRPLHLGRVPAQSSAKRSRVVLLLVVPHKTIHW